MTRNNPYPLIESSGATMANADGDHSWLNTLGRPQVTSISRETVITLKHAMTIAAPFANRCQSAPAFVGPSRNSGARGRCGGANMPSSSKAR